MPGSHPIVYKVGSWKSADPEISKFPDFQINNCHISRLPIFLITPKFPNSQISKSVNFFEISKFPNYFQSSEIPDYIQISKFPIFPKMQISNFPDFQAFWLLWDFQISKFPRFLITSRFPYFQISKLPNHFQISKFWIFKFPITLRFPSFLIPSRFPCFLITPRFQSFLIPPCVQTWKLEISLSGNFQISWFPSLLITSCTGTGLPLFLCQCPGTNKMPESHPLWTNLEISKYLRNLEIWKFWNLAFCLAGSNWQTWKSRNLEIWKWLGDLKSETNRETWTSRSNQGTWQSGIRKSGSNWENWKSGNNQGTWKSGNLEIWQLVIWK